MLFNRGATDELKESKRTTERVQVRSSGLYTRFHVRVGCMGTLLPHVRSPHRALACSLNASEFRNEFPVHIPAKFRLMTILPLVSGERADGK